MASLRYTCSDCQHEWNGNDFTTECSNCNSHEISISKSGPTPVGFKFKKILLVVSAFVILLILVNYFRPPVPGGEGRLNFPTKVKIMESDNDWIFKAYFTDDQGTRRDLRPSEIKEIRNVSANNTAVMFDKKTGQIFPCYKDTNQANYKFIFKNPVYSPASRSAKLELYRNEPNALAKCPVYVKSDDFKVVEVLNCEYELRITNKDKGIFKENLKISVNGINGPYTKDFRWNPSEMGLKIINVFILFNSESDTVKGYYQNGNSYRYCAPCNEQTKSADALQIKKLAQSFFLNPNRKHQKIFRDKVLSFKNPSLTLDGQSIDIADLINAVRTGGKDQFSLEVSIKISDDCNTLTLSFDTKS